MSSIVTRCCDRRWRRGVRGCAHAAVPTRAHAATHTHTPIDTPTRTHGVLPLDTFADRLRHVDAARPCRRSLYFMWVATGRQRYRRAGWRMFSAFQRHARTSAATFGALAAYTSLGNAFVLPPSRRDEMPSWWLAETLKYLWLLFQPRDFLPMDEWVFNTEAHPLPTFAAAEPRRGGTAAPGLWRRGVGSPLVEQ